MCTAVSSMLARKKNYPLAASALSRVSVGVAVVMATILMVACEGSSSGESRSQPTPPLAVALTTKQLTSLDEARAAVRFQLLMPTMIPVAFELSKIEHVFNDVPKTPSANFLVIDYRTADGGMLRIRQGWPVAYDNGVYRFAPDDEKGRTTVQGQPAVWVRGVVTQANPNPVWEPGPLALRWITGEVNQFGGSVVYAIESDVLTLDELLVIAETVEPYRSE